VIPQPNVFSYFFECCERKSRWNFSEVGPMRPSTTMRTLGIHVSSRTIQPSLLFTSMNNAFFRPDGLLPSSVQRFGMHNLHEAAIVSESIGTPTSTGPSMASAFFSVEGSHPDVRSSIPSTKSLGKPHSLQRA